MTGSIRITLKLFAAYQEVCGSDQRVMEVPVGTLVADLRDRLIDEHPILERWRSVTRFGVNLEFVPPETRLQDGDEVALIPPVSGG